MKGYMKTFNELTINPLIVSGIEKMKFEHMTEVQEKVIPLALEGKDVIAQAPTGTGKTVAYAIPVLNKIDEEIRTIQAVIIAPTRELAVQICEEINSVAYYQKGIKAVPLYGGESIERQIMALKKKPQIIACTPGRLMDHMDRKTVRLEDVKTVVLDEADEMLNMGFKEDIDFILESIKTEHQTMLFSATISKEIERIANTFLVNPEVIRISINKLTVPSIEQRYIEVKEKDKVEIISRLIDINEYKLVMMFCNTKRMVDEVTSQLLLRGYMVEALHGDMKQMQRDRVMARFRGGQLNILVASDVAARGLDISGVDAVINYDVPTDEEYYVHRIGRTGRAEKLGLSITLVTRNEKNHLRSIINYTKADINVMSVPSLESVMKFRIKKVVDEAIAAQHEENNYQKYIDICLSEINKEEINKDQLINGLIMLHMKNNENNVEIEEIKDEIKDRKRIRDQEYTRIFINVGKKDKIKVYNLTDWFVQNTSLANADINGIDIRDNFSFCDIPTQAIDEVLKATTENDFNGKIINIEIAKSKESSSKSRGSRSFSSRSDRPRREKSSTESENNEQKNSSANEEKNVKRERSKNDSLEKERTYKDDSKAPRGRRRSERSDSSSSSRQRSYSHDRSSRSDDSSNDRERSYSHDRSSRRDSSVKKERSYRDSSSRKSSRSDSRSFSDRDSSKRKK